MSATAEFNGVFDAGRSGWILLEFLDWNTEGDDTDGIGVNLKEEIV